MALFRYFRPVPRGTETELPIAVPNYMPEQTESGVNVEEYGNVSAIVSELADPTQCN